VVVVEWDYSWWIRSGVEMSTHRRSDRSRVSLAVAGLIRQDRKGCNCCRVNSAEAETTRPTLEITVG
jgi:hypothetical protein